MNVTINDMNMVEEDGSCSHVDILNDFCQDCGEFMEGEISGSNPEIRYDDDFFINKREKKEKFNYINELSRLDLPKNVCKEVCDQISFLQEKTHVRKKTYFSNLFVMIYIAYNQLDLEFNPFIIGEKLKMSQAQIKLAIKIASRGIDEKSYKNPICVIDPSSFIEQMSLLFEKRYKICPPQITKLKEFIHLIISKNKMISNENPRGIAATILKMFYDYNDIVIPDFFEKISRTPGYIKTIENSIRKTLNNFEANEIENLQ